MSDDPSLADDDVLIEIAGAQTTACAVIGQVVQAGARAASMVGRQVLAGPIDPCGECDVCRAGGAAVCPHARRRHAATVRTMVASARWLVPLGDGLALPSPAGAVVAGDVAVAYTAYARTGLGPRDPVIVVGADPIVRFLVEILLAKSIPPVVIADPARAAWCAWLAARGVMVARATSAAEAGPAIKAAIASASGGAGTGMPDATAQAGATVAQTSAARAQTGSTQGGSALVGTQISAGTRPWRILAIASPGMADAVAVAATLAGPRATLTVVGDGTADLAGLVAREITVIGVAGAHPDLVVEAAAMCQKGEVDLAGGTDRTENDLMRAIVRTF